MVPSHAEALPELESPVAARGWCFLFDIRMFLGWPFCADFEVNNANLQWCFNKSAKKNPMQYFYYFHLYIYIYKLCTSLSHIHLATVPPNGKLGVCINNCIGFPCFLFVFLTYVQYGLCSNILLGKITMVLL